MSVVRSPPPAQPCHRRDALVPAPAAAGRSSRVSHPLRGRDGPFPATAPCQGAGWKCLLCAAKEQSSQSPRGGTHNVLKYNSAVRPAARLALKRH